MKAEGMGFSGLRGRILMKLGRMKMDVNGR